VPTNRFRRRRTRSGHDTLAHGLLLRCTVARPFLVSIAVGVLLASSVCYSRPPVGPSEKAEDGDPILVGAGDIASCLSAGDEATADLLKTISGTVFTLGDNVYGSATLDDFANCYEPSWGRYKARTKPAVGNHEYQAAGAAGYFAYFGASAGEPDKGYYSYDLGAWHVVVINSNCAQVGGCQAGSRQERWLRQDLAAHRTKCTLAYWHHPLFSSGKHGNAAMMIDVWRALYEYDADLVLNGHDHDYERFQSQTPDGAADAERGVREFVVGTGGKSLYGFGQVRPNSEKRNADTWGVLKLVLHPASYEWEFLPQAGRPFTDSGTGACH